MTHGPLSHTRQKGEVAWLLTVISLVVIGAGLVIGFNINTQESAALRTSPFAQGVPTATPAPSKKLLTEPRNVLPRVCFPFLDKDADGKTDRVSDPFCTARLIPLSFTNFSRSDKDFMSGMQGTDMSKPRAERVNRVTSVNPFVRLTNPTADLTSIANPDVTPASPTSFTFHGGLCILEGAADQLDVSKLTVYLSPFYVRKYEPFTGTGTASPDERDEIIVDANKIATGALGQNIQLTEGDAQPRPTTKATSICNYKSGVGALQTNRSTFRYPILFKLNFELAELKRILLKPDLKNHPDVKKFDTKECSLYLHARGLDSGGDVYNIARIDLRDVIGAEAAAALCPPTTPTPTSPSVTPTATPTATPTVTLTATPTPVSALACSESCSINNTACGTYSDPEQGGTQQPLVCASVRDFVDLCENSGTGFGCTCVPEKCLGPLGLCSSEQLACGKAPKKKITPTVVTPTEVKPQDISCSYNALAFVEECIKVDPVTGACEVRGARTNAKPFTQTVLGNESSPRPYVWGTSNNNQRANANNNVRPASMIPATSFSIFSKDAVLDLAARYIGFPFNTVTESSGLLAYEPMSAIDVSSTQRIQTQSKDRKTQIKELLRQRVDIKIEHASELPVPQPPLSKNLYTNEQYTNFSKADVKLAYDSDAYRILPNGKRIYKCTNELAAELAKLDPRDPQAALAKKACDDESQEQSKILDTLHGFKVGCGQNIVYGWTLQKCNFDFDIIFVIDTSLTMTEIDPTSPVQQTKLQRAQLEIKNFLNYAHDNFGANTRVGLVSFNKATVPYSAQNGSSDGGAGIQTQKLLSVKDDASLNQLKQKVDGLVAAEGTCIQCGLKNAQTLVNQRSEPTGRTPIVILLSDGLVNAYPGARVGNPVLGSTNSNPGGTKEVYDVADTLRADDNKTLPNLDRKYGENSDITNDVLLLALGYGDVSIKRDSGQDFDTMIRVIASNMRDKDNRITDNRRWAYSTDRKANAPLVDFSGIFAQVKTDLNSCSQVGLAYEKFQKAKDVNIDGIVNTIDLFTVFDNYYAKGQNIKEDINGDGVVNVNDVVLIIESLGTVIAPTDSTASGSGNITDDIVE